MAIPPERSVCFLHADPSPTGCPASSAPSPAVILPPVVPSSGTTVTDGSPPSSIGLTTPGRLSKQVTLTVAGGSEPQDSRAAARGSLVGTMSFPSGAMATAASLKFPSPSGIPMMVRQRSSPDNRWAIAIHSPMSTNQMTFPIVDAAPAVGRRTTVLPNGQRTYAASRNDAIPNGMVMMRTHITIPASTYARKSQIPERSSHRRFRTIRTGPSLPRAPNGDAFPATMARHCPGTRCSAHGPC